MGCRRNGDSGRVKLGRRSAGLEDEVVTSRQDMDEDGAVKAANVPEARICRTLRRLWCK